MMYENTFRCQDYVTGANNSIMVAEHVRWKLACV